MKWPTISLGNLCVGMSSGGTPPSNVAEYYGGEIPWLRTQEVVFNRIRSTELFITEKGLQNSAAKWIPAPAVVVAMYGNSAGRSAISEIPLTTNQACCNLVVDEAKADFRFVFYQLVMRYEELKGLSKGAAQNNLNAAQVREFKIGVPSLPTQRRIAEILSAYDDLIENNQRRMKLLEESARLRYEEWFVRLRFPGHEHTKIVDGLPEGWSRKQLEEIAEFRLGKMLDQKKNRGDLMPYLANINVRWGKFDLNDLREMRFEGDEIETCGLKFGDIVMCEGGEPGRCAIWKDQMPRMMIQKALHRIRCRENIDPEYLYYSLRHAGQSGYLATLFTGATIKHLPREKLEKVTVVVPTRSLMDSFISVIRPIENQLGLLDSANKRASNARDLLLPRLMNGEIEL